MRMDNWCIHLTPDVQCDTDHLPLIHLCLSSMDRWSNLSFSFFFLLPHLHSLSLSLVFFFFFLLLFLFSLLFVFAILTQHQLSMSSAFTACALAQKRERKRERGKWTCNATTLLLPLLFSSLLFSSLSSLLFSPFELVVCSRSSSITGTSNSHTHTQQAE